MSTGAATTERDSSPENKNPNTPTPSTAEQSRAPAHADARASEPNDPPEDHPSGKADAEAEPNVSGTWNSLYGTVRLTQKGSLISGTLTYANGSGAGRITGKITGRTITFRGSDLSGQVSRSIVASGKATLSEDGRTMSGLLRGPNGESFPILLQRAR
jgi:hypothetical protein